MNSTSQEEEAIKGLAKDKSIKILKEEKGNVTVVMDRLWKDYENKFTAMVNTEEYRKINRDPTKAIEAKVHRSLKSLVEDLGVNIRNLTPNTSKPHIFLVSQKCIRKFTVHKEVYPLRAIESGIASPCHSFERFLLNIITLVAGKRNTHIDNSIDFIHQVREIKTE
jgi:hypothetical protein